MNARLRDLWVRARRVPARTRFGVLIAVVAIAGLAWQHQSGSPDSTTAPQQAAPETGQLTRDGDGFRLDGHALGEFQPDPRQLPPPPDFSAGAARSTVERFAANFAAPNGDREDWLARLSEDVMPELLAQYRLTDLRNVPQAAVEQVRGPLPGDPLAPAFQVTYTDGTGIEATMDMGSTGWKVSTVIPVSAAESPAPPDDPTGSPPGADPTAPAEAPAVEPTAAPSPAAPPTPGLIPVMQTAP